MAKDKEGHGSEAHREGHKPQVEQGKYGKGEDYHDEQYRHRAPAGSLMDSNALLNRFIKKPL